MPKQTRRDFLKTSAMAAASLAMPTIILGRQDKGKVRFACIGIGGRGGADLESAAKNGVVTALCDIDQNTLVETMKKYPGAATFTDYRSMIEKMHTEFDAVTVATPDHNHAAAAALAMRHGKHVYVEKP